jgi:hypothetical protein
MQRQQTYIPQPNCLLPYRVVLFFRFGGPRHREDRVDSEQQRSTSRPTRRSPP